jgi:hypothetical protein
LVNGVLVDLRDMPREKSPARTGIEEIRPVVVHPTKRADLSRHGYRAAQFEDAFARFLPPEPNIRTLKRGGGEKT